MKNFKELDKRPVNEVEASILSDWKKNKIFEKTIEKPLVFLYSGM